MDSILTLYSGPDCSLCDIALQMISAISPEAYVELSVVNVRDDHALYHQYGARIPVLARHDTGESLFWPFDESQLIQFLS